MSLRPSVYTIPPHRAFADALAAGLLARHGQGPLGLAQGIVLVPNNRAARALTDAFVRRSDKGLLLPRLVPVGDPELDERIGGALEPLGEGERIPPAIDPVERLMLLARLVQRHGDVDAAEALRLAQDLARTLDQLLIEEIDPARLRGIAADLPDLSIHWQKSLDRLGLILNEWPALLKERGRIDLAERRNRLLAAVARRWQAEPPRGFVAAVGITTTAPAVARLLKTVAHLEQGMVVLPALDTAMPDEEWDALGPHDPDPVTGRRPRAIETHPQFQLKLLLDRMGVGRGEVERWRWGGGRDAPAVRSRAIAHAMAPARFTGKWQELKPAERRLGGVRALELADPAEEAQAIALALREALETPERTAALVTPDRNLARRVSAHLKRWGIEADDSAGRPLSQTPPGTLLLALATAAAESFAPVSLLTVLKHPLVMKEEGRLDWLEGVRMLDLALRGPRPPAGLQGIADYLADTSGRDGALRRRASLWWKDGRRRLEALEAAFAVPQPKIAELLGALRSAASDLTQDAVWAGPAGRAAADLFASAEPAAEHGPGRLDRASLAPLLQQLMDAVAVRPPYGQHPRIFIWGLLEARLQHADLMILAGLNEGTWPALPTPDPWLAPRIRAELGLPGLERRIGLAAHDFATALGGREVLVTRARRDARAPAIASRLWLRLEAMTGGLTREPRLRRWAQALDRPADYRPAAQPAPVPPADIRPRSISVTEVDRLKADPFAFYARKMLRLLALDPIDADPSPAWRGTAVHDVLEAWMKQDGCDPDKLRPRAEAFLATASAHPLMRALWQPRLLEAIDWVAEQVATNRAAGRAPLEAEIWGSTEIAGVKLGGKADRLDRAADGSLVVIDYKTGMPPGPKAVAEGYSMQLGLLGLIAERGGFEGVEGVPAGFEYWSLAKKAGKLGYVASPVGGRNGLDPAEFTTVAARNFIGAAEKWLTGEEPFTAKLHPEYAPYGEYDQLMRLDEWYGREG
ncbi:double-strand break repair protein AddB [Sphingosinicella sp. LY1275]|uniref:double-strand break repair protein AddB n=1 Tax=Sphingosinicella sp. LY1275 TaxID=3095379 RepID=UPI002ADEF6ED|nr:double-strand break repair protein AddB [Sphingosinicella sp. LY1275]MEA1013538.1 double-strand break repair protein AddB [Sphingosinicella sp. LY1275]